MKNIICLFALSFFVCACGVSAPTSDRSIMNVPNDVDTLYASTDNIDIDDNYYTYVFDSEGFLLSCSAWETIESAYGLDFQFVDGMPSAVTSTYIDWWADVPAGQDPPKTETRMAFEYEPIGNNKIAVMNSVVDGDEEPTLISTITVDDENRVIEVAMDDQPTRRFHYDAQGNAFDENNKPVIICLAVIGVYQPALPSKFENDEEIMAGDWIYSVVRKK